MTTIAATERLDVGRVVQTTFAVIRRNFRTLAPMALLCVGLPEALLGLLQSFDGADANASTSLVGTITQCILQGGVTHAVIADLNGRHAGFKESLSRGVKVFLPLWGISILAGLGVLLGLVLLVVPGVILACMWVVAGPARVAEGPGVRAALGRSRQLTKGYRWTVILLVLIMLAALIVLGGLSALGGVGTPVSLIVFSPLAVAALALLGTTGVSVLYAERRRIKEGATPESLAAVFD